MPIIKDVIATELNQVRSSQSFEFCQEIHKPFGVLDQVIDWCKANIEAEWRWELIQPSSDRAPGRYRFYFDSERDLCAFSLRWS